MRLGSLSLNRRRREDEAVVPSTRYADLTIHLYGTATTPLPPTTATVPLAALRATVPDLLLTASLTWDRTIASRTARSTSLQTDAQSRTATVPARSTYMTDIWQTSP